MLEQAQIEEERRVMQAQIEEERRVMQAHMEEERRVMQAQMEEQRRLEVLIHWNILTLTEIVAYPDRL